jgi:hypothetical protein
MYTIDNSYADYYGDFVLTESNIKRIIRKYHFPSGDFRFKTKYSGNYYLFKTPENKNYIIGYHNLTDKLVGIKKSKYECNELYENNTFSIKNNDYFGILQFKKVVSGDYYAFTNSDKKEVILSGLDLDLLSKHDVSYLLKK